MQHIFEYYKDSAGDWRWKIRYGNGDILIAGSKGYKTKEDMFEVFINLAEAFAHIKQSGPRIFNEVKA